MTEVARTVDLGASAGEAELLFLSHKSRARVVDSVQFRQVGFLVVDPFAVQIRYRHPQNFFLV